MQCVQRNKMAKPLQNVQNGNTPLSNSLGGH
jgi:hypothetical protein